MAPPYVYTSHESFTHDSIASLAFDWERMGNPGIAPRPPFKVYLPRSTGDVVRAVKEARALGQKLTLRSKGHSSNDLVLAEGGSILALQMMDGILGLDAERRQVTVQSGAALAEVDEYLMAQGFGLPVIGDHSHITAGGFASVGGISPASHRYGLFLDTVRELQYVTWEGEVRRCGRTEDVGTFHRILGGTGRFGVITELVVDVVPMDKRGTILHNRPRFARTMEDFITRTTPVIMDPGEARMERGVFMEYPVLGRKLVFGQFSTYLDTAQSRWKSLVNRVSYGFLHGIGMLAGRLPRRLDVLLKYVGTVGVMLSPRYASIKNVEVFTDRILDSSVGDPTRMLIVLGPAEKYGVLFRELFPLFRDYRDRYGCFTFLSLYVKAIRSEYLGQGDGAKPFCELMFYVGTQPEALTQERLDALVARVDAACIQHGALRYMHTKTSQSPAIRQQVDPNERYASRAAEPVSSPQRPVEADGAHASPGVLGRASAPKHPPGETKHS